MIIDKVSLLAFLGKLQINKLLGNLDTHRKTPK